MDHRSEEEYDRQVRACPPTKHNTIGASMEIGDVIDLESPNTQTYTECKINGKWVFLEIPKKAKFVRLVEEKGVFSLMKQR